MTPPRCSCRGGTESTRYAVQLISALIQDPAKELEDLIPRGHIRAPGAHKTGSSFPPPGGGAKALASMAPASSMSFQPSSSSSSSAAGKLGKGVSSGVRPGFPVSLPLAYAHPQLALLAAQTMQQIRHPRLPMAQFGGTFAPAPPGTWGPFPVRPVSPSSANGSPKHNGTPGPRPGPAHAEYAAAAASGNPASATATPPSAPAPPCPPSAHTPSSARKQLFAAEPKVATATSSTFSTRVAGSPAHPHSSALPLATPSTPPPAPIAPPPQQPSKPEPCAAAPPAKDKPPLEATPVSVAPDAASSADPLPFSAPPTSLPLPQPPVAFTTSTEPSAVAPPSSANPAPSSTVAHSSGSVPHYANSAPSGSIPHYANSAPRMAHRMQPSGPFYPLPEQQSVFVPLATPPEPLKQAHSGPAPLALNGSQVRLHSAGKAPPPSLGPALFSHFSSIFDSSQVGSSQVWGACHLPARSPPEPPYSGPPAYMSMGPMEAVPPPPDGSKAPGYRSASQRMVSSPIGEPRRNTAVIG